jgi:hypothetical protein
VNGKGFVASGIGKTILIFQPDPIQTIVQGHGGGITNTDFAFGIEGLGGLLTVAITSYCSL